MKLFFTGRPSALPAAPVQVVAVTFRTAVSTAHVPVVGRPAVRIRTASGAPQLSTPLANVKTQLPASRNAGGFAVEGIDRDEYGMNGASGVPPRGSPV